MRRLAKNGKTRHGARPLVAVLAFLALGSSSHAEVLLTEKAALERVFPGEQPVKRVLYLRPEQLSAIEKEARSKMSSAVVTVFETRSGRAVLDTHLVRTMPETVLVAMEPDGRLRSALVLQFAEPPDYLPREGWLRTLEGKALDEELWPGRGVRRVSGATLTVQALTDAVRRALALDRLVLRGTP